MAYTSPIVTVLDALSDGRIIRRVVTIALAVAAWMVLVVAGIGTVGVLVALSSGGSGQPETVVGGIIFAALVGATGWGQFEVLRYRARTVASLGSSPLTVTPIVSCMFRLIGETYAMGSIGLGVGGFVLSLFGAHHLASASSMLSVPFLPGIPLVSGGFLAGLGILMLSALSAFCGVLLSYFLAEAVLVVVDIARNVRTLVQQRPEIASVVPSKSPEDGSLEARGPDRPPAVVEDRSLAPKERTCPRCAAPTVDPGSQFCGTCGASLLAGTP